MALVMGEGLLNTTKEPELFKDKRTMHMHDSTPSHKSSKEIYTTFILLNFQIALIHFQQSSLESLLEAIWDGMFTSLD